MCSDRAEPDDTRLQRALVALQGARRARSAPEVAEEALRQALSIAPDHFEVQLAAYRFYFYNHRYADAVGFGEVLLETAARRLNISTDWRRVHPGDAAFADIGFAPGLYLQALTACGYCHLRLGQMQTGRAMMEQAAALDPTGRFGANGILACLDAPEDC
ncbi:MULTISPECIES: hypothetical protein [Actibacterium]|uniref:Tetratricopeptide (TPR) repeat protein n=1 Tax=Actibacterium naphthalenivorans TaxID=1614693 RepID=A0A840C6I8_9RHOB|nr:MULTISPECIES: hypothetical protein [Actibacterium]MBB4020700.1 tetratricopeptide (TPR) repeat protein [Actibacterium naphthalenivorans]